MPAPDRTLRRMRANGLTSRASSIGSSVASRWTRSGWSAQRTSWHGPWNAPNQPGEYIQHALLIDGETRLAVRDAFMWYFDKVLDVYEPGDEFDAASIEQLINQLRDALNWVSKGP